MQRGAGLPRLKVSCVQQLKKYVYVVFIYLGSFYKDYNVYLSVWVTFFILEPLPGQLHAIIYTKHSIDLTSKRHI